MTEMYFHKTPTWLKSMYPSLIWNLNREKRAIYLTFDDGPTPQITLKLLFLLADQGVKATFFCVGENIIKHPEIFEQIKREGHAIGNHTHKHLNAWKVDAKSYLEDIKRCQLMTQTDLFRPPYGKIKIKDISNLKEDYRIIMWDVLSGDFDLNLSKEKCLENTINSIQNGSIVTFHDNLKSQEKLFYVVPKLIKWAKENGYTFEVL